MKDLKNKKLFLLDMDGTIYLGNRLFDGVNQTLDVMRKHGKVVFLTNNSSRSAKSYVEKLTRLGVKCSPDEIYSSGMATAEYISEKYGHAKIALIGTESYRSELESYGHVITEDEPDLVLLSFDVELTYKKLLNATKWISRGKPYIATHPDINCPAEDCNMPDAGSFIEMIYTSTGRRPDLICGKPYGTILAGALKRYGAKREEACMVGDRLSTDIAFGVRNDLTSVLVMTGETTYEMLEKSDIKPTYVFDHIAQFITVLGE